MDFMRLDMDHHQMCGHLQMKMVPTNLKDPKCEKSKKEGDVLPDSKLSKFQPLNEAQLLGNPTSNIAGEDSIPGCASLFTCIGSPFHGMGFLVLHV